jgi:hypothetical protein
LLSKNVNIKIYKTIIVTVVLYGCLAWSLTPREEHRLRVFENRVLRRIFGPKRKRVMRGWRELHNEEFLELVLFTKYYYDDLIKEDEMGRTCKKM